MSLKIAMGTSDLNKGNTAKTKGNLNPYSAVIDFSRQNLTSVDAKFWRLKSIPAL